MNEFHAVPGHYITEANDALLVRLGDALQERDWVAVEALAGALHELARAFTVPGGPNA